MSSGDTVGCVIDFSDESQPDYLQENMDTTVYYTNKTTDKQIFRIILSPINVKKENSPTATIEVYENKNSFSPGLNHGVVKESMTNGLLSGMTEIANWDQDEYENISVKFVCGHHLGDITFEQKVNITSDQSMHVVFPQQFNNNPIDVTVTATVRNIHGKFNGFRFDPAITAAAMVKTPVSSTTTNTAAQGDVSLDSTGSTTSISSTVSNAY